MESVWAPPAGRSEAAPVTPAWRPVPGRGRSRARPFLSSSVEGRSIPGQFRASFKTGTQERGSPYTIICKVWAASGFATRIKRFQRRPEPDQPKKKSKKGCRHTPLFTVFGPPHVEQCGYPIALGSGPCREPEATPESPEPPRSNRPVGPKSSPSATGQARGGGREREFK